MDQNLTLQLHDISTIVAIPDYSLYYFIALVGALVMGIGITLYLLWRYIANKRRLDRKKAAYLQLRAQELDDSKTMAYLLSATAVLFKENTRIQQQYDDLHQRMQRYKYQKEVPPFSDDDRAQIELYLDLIEAEL